MATDNRIEIDDCDQVGNWTGDTTPALNTDLKYEGTGCLQVQATNTYRSWYEASISPALNLTSSTVYFLIKAGNPETKANGGIRAIIGDGTNRRSYYVGGNDDPGLPVKGGWNCYRLDTANLPAAYSQGLGSVQPSLNAIVSVGMGVLQAAKATGNSPNTFFDRICYIANGSPAFRVNAGTSGTPINFAKLVSDDETNGWGFFNNPIAGSKLYCVYGAVRWGDDAALSYFADSNAQVFIRGAGLSAGTMNQSFLGYSGGTNSFVLNNCVVVSIGAVPNWDFNVANHNILKITNSQFIGHGTISCLASDANKYITGTIFDTCGKITVSTMKFEDNVVRNAGGDGITISSVSHGVKNCRFNTNVHSIEITVADSYSFDGCNFLGSDGGTYYDVENTTAGTVTFSYTNSDNAPQYANNSGGGTTDFVGSVIFELTGMQQYTEVTIVRISNGATLFKEEVGVDGKIQYEYNVSLLGGVDVYILIHDVGYVPILIDNYSLPTVNTSIPISQYSDRVYANP